MGSSLRIPGMLALAACLLAAAGCGQSAGRRSVDRYFRQVAAVQHDLAPELSRINEAYRNFSLLPRGSASETRSLEDAERTVGLLRIRVAALDAPPKAARMQKLLLRLLALDMTTARELRTTAVYLPASQRALAPLTKANRSLRTELKAAKGPAAQARALDGYAAAVALTETDFRGVRAPALLRPSYDAQLATFARVKSVAAQLATALRARDRAAIARLVPELRDAGSAAAGAGAAEARAIQRYNARVRAIGRLSSAIGRERTRLEQSL
jgi:hypothetical protein